MDVVARYRHPKGSVIAVYANGAIVKTNPAGKVVSTSATAEKLAAGHGGWTLMDGDAPAPAAPSLTERQAAPTRTLLPMKFRQAEVTDLPKFVTDDRWWMQQKLDGIRAQLVFEPGRAPWFRNSTGGRLVSDTAAPVVNQILALFAGVRVDEGYGFVVDGEVIGGEFWAFDYVRDGGENDPLSVRLDALAVWYMPLGRAADGSNVVRLLPTAKTMDEKHALAERVHAQGGEGWIAKRVDGGYRWGTRVEHSLKLKLTHTVDVVVMERNRDGKSNFVIGLYRDGVLCEVGGASAIGKPDAQVGDVVEVKYLYCGADGRLVQPTVLRLRGDKPATDCDAAQLRFADKTVVTL